MAARILYMGDTSLQTAASYLAGVMTHARWSFDYIASDQQVEAAVIDRPYRLYVISDLPSRQMGDDAQQRLLARIEQGAGLLMIGGWESFRGCDGYWDRTRIADALPVAMAPHDDRMNCDHPVLVRRKMRHAVVADLPWETNPPVIGGLNRLTAKPDAAVLLTAQHFLPRIADDSVEFESGDHDPLLIVGDYGVGRVAALATDVAPHWVGGLVDWGTSRVSARAPGAEAIEVGDRYAQLFRQLLSWTGNFRD